MDPFTPAARCKESQNYYTLLRALFRAIGGAAGRFEHLYKEVLRLLPEMLETLNKHAAATPPSDERRARTGHDRRALPHSPRPSDASRSAAAVPRAAACPVTAGPIKLVAQGLRILELCIDNLQPEYFHTPLTPVLPTLIRGLNAHLKPLPSSHLHSHTTVRIPGKLGGKNRLLLHNDPALDYRAPVLSHRVVRSRAADAARSVIILYLAPLLALNSFLLNLFVFPAPTVLFKDSVSLASVTPALLDIAPTRV